MTLAQTDDNTYLVANMGEATPTKKEPTAAEAMFFYAIVKHTRNKADIDWNAVAEEQGFKNADVAKVSSISQRQPKLSAITLLSLSHTHT